MCRRHPPEQLAVTGVDVEPRTASRALDLTHHELGPALSEDAGLPASRGVDVPAALEQVPLIGPLHVSFLHWVIFVRWALRYWK